MSELTGEYETKTPVTVIELTKRVCKELDCWNTKYPANDPIQNSAKQIEYGKGQNAYSQTDTYLPDTPNLMPTNTFKGSAKVHVADDMNSYARQLRSMVKHVWSEYTKQTEKPSPPAYKKGIACTVTEKFGWKVGLIEDSIEDRLADIDALEPVSVGFDELAKREKKGHDIVMNNGHKEVTFQVKTGSSNNAKQADYLIKANVSIDTRKIQFTVERA